MFQLPRLYCILDASCFHTDADIFSFFRGLLSTGATLIQYRDKRGTDRQILSHARELLRISRTTNYVLRPTLLMNDRADLALAAGFDGVHLGQDDLSPAAARRVIGADHVVGVSTHNLEQLRAAATDCDYVAVGPVFATASKQNPDPVVGLEGVSTARAALDQLVNETKQPRKPLVAIGGITRKNCMEVISAGADSVAVISGLLPDPARFAAEFLQLLG
jgi:thiamine-phosphate pyrophosphorylase